MVLNLNINTNLMFVEKIYELNYINSKRLIEWLPGVISQNKELHRLESPKSFYMSIELENRLRTLNLRLNRRCIDENVHVSTSTSSLTDSSVLIEDYFGQNAIKESKDEKNGGIFSPANRLQKNACSIYTIKSVKSFDSIVTRLKDIRDIYNLPSYGDFIGEYNSDADRDMNQFLNFNVTEFKDAAETSARFSDYLLSSQFELLDDLQDEKRILLSKMCNELGNILLFSMECMNSELYTLNRLEHLVHDVLKDVNKIMVGSESTLPKFSERLKSYRDKYINAVKTYNKSLSKLSKLEKNLEYSIFRWKGIISGKNDVTAGTPHSSSALCDKSELNLNDIIYDHCSNSRCMESRLQDCELRVNQFPLIGLIFDDSRDYVRYTNYIEQLSLSHYLLDSLRVESETFDMNMRNALSGFVSDYQDNIYSFQQKSLQHLINYCPVFLNNSVSLYQLYENSVLDGNESLKFDDMNCTISGNRSLDEFILYNIKKSFEYLRDLYRQMARFHQIRYNSISNSNLNECKLGNSYIGVYFSILTAYHRSLHAHYNDLFNLISSTFPLSFSRRYNGGGYMNIRRLHSNDELISEFLMTSGACEFKITDALFGGLRSNLEKIIQTSISSALSLCDESIKLCNDNDRWSKLPMAVANANGMNISDESDLNEVKFAHELKSMEIGKVVSELFKATEMIVVATVDYNEVNFGFSFNKGDYIHVKIAGCMPLWYGHCNNGVDRWFPAKFVKVLDGYEGLWPWYRFSDVDVNTHLDRYLIDDGNNQSTENKSIGPNKTLTPRTSLKQSFILKKICIDGHIEYEFKCALIKKISLQGTMYITNKRLGFFSSFNDATIFGSNTALAIDLGDVESLHLKPNRKFPFKIKIVLKNGEEYTFYSLTNTRRIYSAISKVSEFTEEVSNKPDDMYAFGIHKEELETFFGTFAPLTTTILNANVQMTLMDFVKGFESNIDPDSPIAMTRLKQMAFEFGGDVEDVVFKWNKNNSIQYQQRMLTYKFRLSNGGISTKFLKRHCGKSNENIKYALVNDSQFIYQSVSNVEDVPCSKLFYTIFRVVATVGGNKTNEKYINVRIEGDVIFNKHTIFANVIINEAMEKFESAASIICPSNVKLGNNHNTELENISNSHCKYKQVLLFIGIGSVLWYIKQIYRLKCDWLFHIY